MTTCTHDYFESWNKGVNGDEVLEAIDPSLKFVRFLGSSDIVTGTCQAELDGEDVVIKYFSRGIAFNPQLQRELKALRKLKDVRRVPNLVREYDTFDYRAICRVHVEGVPLTQYHGPRDGLQESALSLVQEINARGVCDLDLRADSNYLVRQGKVWLFDFGTARFRSEEKLFDDYSKGDVDDVRGRLLI